MPIDNHIQGISREVLEKALINKEPFIDMAFSKKSDIEYLHAKDICSTLNQLQSNNSWQYVAYSLSCFDEDLNKRSNEIILKKFSGKSNIHLVAATNPSKMSISCMASILPYVAGFHFKPTWIDFRFSNRTHASLEFMESSGKPLFLHMDYIYLPSKTNIDQQSILFYILKRYPKLKVVLEHCGGGIFLAEAYPPYKSLMSNVYYTCSSPRSPGLIKSLFQSVDSKRIGFGSDYPFIGKTMPDQYLKEVDNKIRNIDNYREDWYDNLLA